MIPNSFEIKKYNDSYRVQILSIWEESVLATHDFLLPSDFSEIKSLVAAIDFNDIQVYCLTGNDLVIGFIGVANKKIEMLFLHPTYLGQGLGRNLLDFAVRELKADKVDVNEQNVKAFNFYKKYGFEVVERTEKDDQDKSYPLLRMELKGSHFSMHISSH